MLPLVPGDVLLEDVPHSVDKRMTWSRFPCFPQTVVQLSEASVLERGKQWGGCGRKFSSLVVHVLKAFFVCNSKRKGNAVGQYMH